MKNSISSPAHQILESTAKLRQQLLQHPVYQAIQTHTQLQVFMRHHAFAVLDFMWLLKRLQADLCASRTPWTPPKHPALSRFVNEIVLGEESDDDGRGGYCSHYELYRDAMADVGAPDDVRDFERPLASGADLDAAFAAVTVPDSVQQFVRTTYRLATNGTSAEAAAAFCFGREDIIPDMFQRLLDGFRESGLSMPGLEYYIERHIELDGDHHGPLALQMVDLLCGDSDELVEAATAAARDAIAARIALWDGVVAELPGS